MKNKLYIDKKCAKANVAVRTALKEHRMAQWELAALIGVAEVTLCRWMRQEMPEDYQKELIELIEKEGE